MSKDAYTIFSLASGTPSSSQIAWNIVNIKLQSALDMAIFRKSSRLFEMLNCGTKFFSLNLVMCVSTLDSHWKIAQLIAAPNGKHLSKKNIHCFVSGFLTFMVKYGHHLLARDTMQKADFRSEIPIHSSQPGFSLINLKQFFTAWLMSLYLTEHFSLGM